MSVTSIEYVLFLAAVILLYFIVPKKARCAVLLAANIGFYVAGGAVYLLYILSAALLTWFAAKRIEAINLRLKENLKTAMDSEEKKALRKEAASHKQRWCTLTIIPVMGIWIVLKYGNFILTNLNGLLSKLHLSWQADSFSVVLPLGMSFYTFVAVGYLIDVYRAKYSAEQNFAKYLLFISYFPHIVQGPFSRYDRLGETLFAEHSFSYDRLCQGASRILWGYCQKLLVADKIGIAVNEIIGHYTDYWGIQIFFVPFLYGVQIYADFSGYMDIVCGFSHILGIELEENFRQPYFAKSIDEFWRRWHMTLGAWFRDYLFYPISMSGFAQKLGRRCRAKFGARAGKLIPSYLALFFVWTATGLWHGANWTYLLWGYLNMVTIIFSMHMEPVYEKTRAFFHIDLETNRLWNLFRMIRTFVLLCVFRFFVKADSVSHAFAMINRMVHAFNRKLLFMPAAFFPKMETNDIWVALIGTLVILVVDILVESGRWTGVKERCPFWLRDIIYVILIYAIILFGGTAENLEATFIYANF